MSRGRVMPFETQATSSAGVTAGDDLDVLAERYARDRCECHADEAGRLRDDLIAAMLPFARRLARRYRNSGEPFTDLEQVARVGLVKAVDRYDPERGSFTAYAMSTIV